MYSAKCKCRKYIAGAYSHDDIKRMATEHVKKCKHRCVLHNGSFHYTWVEHDDEEYYAKKNKEYYESGRYELFLQNISNVVCNGLRM